MTSLLTKCYDTASSLEPAVSGISGGVIYNNIAFFYEGLKSNKDSIFNIGENIKNVIIPAIDAEINDIGTQITNEESRIAREEAERRAREEAERRAREEAERKAREQAEQKAKEEAANKVEVTTTNTSSKSSTIKSQSGGNGANYVSPY